MSFELLVFICFMVFGILGMILELFWGNVVRGIWVFGFFGLVFVCFVCMEYMDVKNVRCSFV